MYRVEMDLQSMQIPLIFLSSFVFGFLVLSFVYKFGMKEKSYEEAIAEQRHNTQSLLGIKPKPKDKKIKKLNKKSKEKDKSEKSSNVENKKYEKIENESVPVNLKNSVDVESDASEGLKNNPDRKKPVKASKLKNKVEENTQINLGLCVKDEYENIVENISNQTENKVQNVKKEIISPKEADKNVAVKNKESEKDKGENVKKDEPKEKSNSLKKDPLKEKGILKKEEKEKKEKLKEDPESNVKNNDKNSIKPIKQVTIDTEKKEIITDLKKQINKAHLTNGYVVNNVSEKKKKKNDPNHVLASANLEGAGISVLLNLVRQAELSRSDLQVLIDFLLNKQHEAPEVIDEWSEGKSDPVQKLKKQLAEKEKALSDEQEMLQGAQMKLKEIRNEQLNERSSFNQKLKYLEEQLQNKQMELQGLNNRMHNQAQALQQVQVQLNDERLKHHGVREELANAQMQRQQLEMHMAQETEVMIPQLRNQIQELSARNEQLLIDITHIQKIGAESEQSYINQLNNFTKELDQKNRQLEELLREKANYDMVARMENDLKNEVAHLKNVLMQQTEELRRHEEVASEREEQLNTLLKQKTISTKLIEKLKEEIQKLQEERSQNLESLENNKLKETDILNLKNELASLKSQLEEQKTKNKTETDSQISIIKKLESELEDQKTKNNELRNKNHTVVEALNAAENRLKSNADNAPDVEKIKSEIMSTELEAQKKFLARLFPEINNLENLSNENWHKESEKLINNYLSVLKKTTTDIEGKLKNYETQLKEQEQKLVGFQTQQQEETLVWKAQIKVKDLELEELKQKLGQTQQTETVNGSSGEEK